MDAALTVFSENGYHRASMDDIALEAKVAKGTLYYHFPSKAQLFKALVIEGLQMITDKVSEALNADLSPGERVMLAIKHNIDLYLEYNRLAHIFFNEMSNGIEPEILNEMKELRDGYIGFIASLLEEGWREGIFKEINFKLAAAGILGMLDGLCSYYLNHKNELQQEEIEQFMYRSIMSTFIVEHERLG